MRPILPERGPFPARLSCCLLLLLVMYGPLMDRRYQHNLAVLSTTCKQQTLYHYSMRETNLVIAVHIQHPILALEWPKLQNDSESPTVQVQQYARPRRLNWTTTLSHLQEKAWQAFRPAAQLKFTMPPWSSYGCLMSLPPQP